jgi:hypothetical protein
MVTSLLVSLWFLSMHGWTGADLKRGTVIMHLCGAITMALNTADAVWHRHIGLAAFDAVAPGLLMLDAAFGPWLLRQISAVPLVAARDDFAILGLPEQILARLYPPQVEPEAERRARPRAQAADRRHSPLRVPLHDFLTQALADAGPDAPRLECPKPAAFAAYMRAEHPDVHLPKRQSISELMNRVWPEVRKRALATNRAIVNSRN